MVKFSVSFFHFFKSRDDILLNVTQAIKEAGIDIDGFLTVGVSAALRQLLEFGLFHGDPHPGNIFAMRDGRIAYVDFGNVAVLSQVGVCFQEMQAKRHLFTMRHYFLLDLPCKGNDIIFF